jgi:hypothetical protein
VAATDGGGESLDIALGASPLLVRGGTLSVAPWSLPQKALSIDTNGPLSKPTPAVRSWLGQPLFMPLMRHS